MLFDETGTTAVLPAKRQGKTLRLAMRTRHKTAKISAAFSLAAFAAAEPKPNDNVF
jgi:hypothetical protein